MLEDLAQYEMVARARRTPISDTPMRYRAFRALKTDGNPEKRVKEAS